MKTNLTKQLDSLGILWRYGTKFVENWLYRKDYIFRETVLLFWQVCLQSYLVSTIKRNCVEITSSYEIDKIHCSSDKLMRAVVVQYAIGRFKTWTGLDWIFGSLKGVICVPQPYQKNMSYKECDSLKCQHWKLLNWYTKSRASDPLIYLFVLKMSKLTFLTKRT